MGVRLNRLLGPVQALVAGQWTDRTASGREAWCCPACGSIADLPETHRVLRGGVVAPVVACANKACPFLDFLTLESHGEEVYG